MKKTILIGLLALVLFTATALAAPVNVTITNTYPADNAYSNNNTWQNFTCTGTNTNSVNATMINMTIYIDGILNQTNGSTITSGTGYNLSAAVSLGDGARSWKCEFCINSTTDSCKNSTAFTLNIDTVTPTGSSLTDSESSGDFKITYTPSETVNTTINYGTCSACTMTSTISQSSRTSSPSITITDSLLTSKNTNYCYNVSFWDQVNQNTTGFTRTNTSGCMSHGSFKSNPATTSSGRTSTGTPSTTTAPEADTDAPESEEADAGKKIAGEVWQGIIDWFKGIRCWFTTKC